MEVKQILNQAQDIWGEQELSLAQIIVRLGKVYGDICRWERGYAKDAQARTERELKKELGNQIFSGIYWCDLLSYDPEACIREAIRKQIEYKQVTGQVSVETEMNMAAILEKGRNIWPERFNLESIIVALGKVFGDICRWERNSPKDSIQHTDQKLMRGMGNVIFSSIRWCDDLGFNIKECLNLAQECQKKIVQEV